MPRYTLGKHLRHETLGSSSTSENERTPHTGRITRPLALPSGAFRLRAGMTALAVAAAVGVPGPAFGKTFIDYFQPTPTVCPVSTNTWGASSSIPRDTCNGLEDTKKPPQWIYWDGKILRAPDGKYHLLGSRWAGSQGHGGWFNSQAILAVSDSSPLGPYVDKGVAYTNGPDSGDRSKGHNVSGVQLPDGTYCMIVSETVPFTIFTATSLDGPWTNKGHAQIDTNGVPVNIPFPGDQHLESNVSLVVRHDGNFEIIQRHGIIAVSTTGVLGPYKVQKPTYTYPAAQTPPSNLATIFPNRQKHTADDPQAPSSVESTYVYAEDPLIWYSGGTYHVLYDYPDDRVGYHLTSPDGIHDWTDRGFAYDPRLAKKLFSNTDGTVVSWVKMERPSVLMENGHITHFTFAVTDVDKGQVTGGSNHGNKIIVMAFDGVSFDNDYGTGGSDAGAGGSGGSDAAVDGTGAGGSGGATGKDAATALGGTPGTGGGSVAAGGAGGASSPSSGSGGSVGTGGRSSAGGGLGSGGATAAGGAAGAAVTGGAKTAGAGGSGRGGATSHGGAAGSGGDNGGCGCTIGGGRREWMGRGIIWMLSLLSVLVLRRRRAPR